MDTYPSFSELNKHESDFTIEICDRDAPVTILAPHGGNIEPHTSEITRLIAGPDWNYFCFNGAKPQRNRDLHITSHRFDERQALALVVKSTVVIAVHGCTKQKPIVYLGGRDSQLKQIIDQELRRQEIPSRFALQAWSGTHPRNICNRGRTGAGVQLEISRPLRDSPKAWKYIARAVRAALQDVMQAPR